MASVIDNTESMELVPQIGSLIIDVKPVQSIQGPPEFYKNDSGPPRGAVFIANYKNFHDKQINKRRGSEKDVNNLIDFFNQMGYKVVKKIEDNDRNETFAAMRLFSEHKIHEEVDSMILVVMSHGLNDNTFVTSNGQTMTSQEVYEIFSDKNCPALKHKPKIFIFQHCRGNNKHLALSMSPISSSGSRKTDKTSSDIMLLYSTISGNVSYRHPKYGTLFIYQICKVFMDKAWESDSDLASLMKEVEEGLSRYESIDIYQRCEHRFIRKKKKFHFNPIAIKSNDAKEDVHTKEEVQIEEDSQSYDSDIFQMDSTIEKHLPKDHGFAENSSVQEIMPNTKNCVLLINNLVGCLSDMDKLKHIFTTLGYDVIGPQLNVTYEEFKEVLKEFKEKDHGESAFIVFYRDGFSDTIVTSDHFAIHFNELQSEFNDTNCPNLSNKPKIFINNLCYFDGDVKYECTYQPESHMGHQEEMDSDSEEWVNDCNEKKSNESIPKIPAERDMFFVNVEMEGSRCDKGSLLTDALNQVLMQINSPKQLMEIMCSVSETLDELQEEESDEYICELRTIKFPSDFKLAPLKFMEN
ncbi:unnamed protein product [Meganyctiphanes norvegica]|uniref:Uncharacterized protein n=1 Tax=Meganyctiphanes norvegica TaxID=48144 RepID=A0AAV2STQ2_MEGNR